MYNGIKWYNPLLYNDLNTRVVICIVEIVFYTIQIVEKIITILFGIYHTTIYLCTEGFDDE